MILPIVVFGHPTLRKPTQEIDKDYEGLSQLVDDMYDTMHKSEGVGLAAPQINRAIRLFVVNFEPMLEEEDLKNEKPEDLIKVFINPKIVEFSGDSWAFNEGCLSVPGMREDVSRPEKILIQYYDKDFNYIEEQYDGMKARVIQHEYDHLEGKLFVDHLSKLRKKLLSRKLMSIAKGKYNVGYRTLLPK